MRISLVLGRSLVVLGSLGAAVLFAETALRATHLGWLNPWVAGYSGRAGFAEGRGFYDYSCNREGFRSRGLDDIPKDGFRLAVLGDSNAWGSGIDDSRRVGDLVAQGLTTTGLPTRAWTFAWPSTTYREFRLQYDRARRIAPHLVIVLGTAGNDFLEILHPPSLPRSWQPVLRSPTIKERLRTLHVYNLLARLAARRPAARGEVRLGSGRCSILFGDPTMPAYTQSPRQACELAAPDARAKAIAATLGDARALVARMKRDRAPFLLLEVPSRLRTECAGDDYTARILEARSQSVADVAALEESLVSALATGIEGATLQNPLNVLAPACATAYFPHDWHLAPDGHRRLAEWLVPLAARTLRSASDPKAPGR
ncbi:MAG TPA: SGNH/GDSL hydrolase family protein [Thermoanaerobaculia bacterium]|nr:SGNH/GDSL hydrolase family protein [Thermoanaerobaculia bacterium]